MRLVSRHAVAFVCQAQGGTRSRQRGHACRRETNGVLHVPVGDPIGWFAAQRPFRFVVGRSGSRHAHGSRHCKRGIDGLQGKACDECHEG